MELSPRMAAAARAARAAACASIVLLKNTNGALPLQETERGPARLAVFGASQVRTPVCEQSLEPARVLNILDALEGAPGVCVDALLAHRTRSFVLEHPEGGEFCPDAAAVSACASSSDAALVVLGRSAEAGVQALSPEEQALLASVRAAFSRTILVIAAPGFVELDETARSYDAIVYLGLAGQEAGGALADILTAQSMPVGRLAFTWPASLHACEQACTDRFCGYRWFDSFGGDVLFPFGYGLGYGKTELGSVSAGIDGSDVTVSVELENTGERYPAGELIQIYASRPDTALEQPVRSLMRFAQSGLLAPGERKSLHLRFPIRELAVFHTQASAYVLDEGIYDIFVGTSSRSLCAAGSIRVTRSVVMQAAEPASMEEPQSRLRRPEDAFVCPGEEESLAFARKHAIRLSDRRLPRLARKKGRPFAGCRSDGQMHTFRDVISGGCSAFTLVASMDDGSLRALADGIGASPASVPGAIGASAELPRYDLPAVQLAGGTQGLRLTRDIPDGDEVRHQYVAVFPAPGLLACSFDPEIARLFGDAVGREMQLYGVGMWMGPGANLLPSPADARAGRLWSEDPLVCGLFSRALAEGVSPYGAAVLHADMSGAPLVCSQGALRDVYARSFAIASGAFRAAQLPECAVGGELLTQDSPLVRAWVLDSGYHGMFFSARPCPGGRTELEKAAVRIVQFFASLPNFR